MCSGKITALNCAKDMQIRSGILKM